MTILFQPNTMEKNCGHMPPHSIKGYVGCLESQNSKAVLRSLNTLAKVVSEKAKLGAGPFIPNDH